MWLAFRAPGYVREDCEVLVPKLALSPAFAQRLRQLCLVPRRPRPRRRRRQLVRLRAAGRAAPPAGASAPRAAGGPGPRAARLPGNRAPSASCTARPPRRGASRGRGTGRAGGPPAALPPPPAFSRAGRHPAAVSPAGSRLRTRACDGLRLFSPR